MVIFFTKHNESTYSKGRALVHMYRVVPQTGTSLLYLPLIYYKLAIYINRKQTLFSVTFLLTIARLICLFKFYDNVLIWITPLSMIEAISFSVSLESLKVKRRCHNAGEILINATISSSFIIRFLMMC